MFLNSQSQAKTNYGLDCSSADEHAEQNLILGRGFVKKWFNSKLCTFAFALLLTTQTAMN